jgi:hypothetical protein
MSANLNIHSAKIAFGKCHELPSGNYSLQMNTGKNNPSVTLYLSSEEWERIKPAVEMLTPKTIFSFEVQS